MTRGRTSVAAAPAAPVLRLALTGGTARVNDAPVPLPSGVSRREALLRVASSLADVLERPVRVLAEDADRAYPVVAHPDGSVTSGWPSGSSEVNVAEGGRGHGRSEAKPRRWLTVALVIALLIATGVLVMVVHGGVAQMAATVAGNPDVTTAPAIPGYSATAAWQLPVAGSSPIAVDGNGTILVRTRTGAVEQISPGTGRTVWSSSASYSPAFAGPVLTRIDTRLSVLLWSAQELVYWPLPPAAVGGAPTPLTAPAPVTIALPPGTVISSAGPSPLLLSGDRQRAGIISGGAARWTQLPSNDTPLIALGSDVLTVNDTTLVRLTATGETRHRLRPPAGATGPASRWESVAGQDLLGIWAPANGQQPVELLDATTGQELFHASLPGVDLRSAPLVRQSSGAQIAVGPLVVDTYTHLLQLLDTQLTVRSLVPGSAYVQTASGSTEAIDLGRPGNFQATAVPARAPIPLATVAAGGTTSALVMTLVPGGALLSAFPRDG